MNRCLKCAPECDAFLSEGPLRYHYTIEEGIHGFEGTKASIQKMGSICPSCGCRTPTPKL